MRRSLIVGAFGAVLSVLAMAGPALAHGDHDARPLARDLPAGPYAVSLWHVYPDAGSEMTPHLIVMLAGGSPADAEVAVTVNGVPMAVLPSTTTANGWETVHAVATGDSLAVTIGDGTQSWQLDPVVVPPPPTSLLPMEQLIWVSIFLTIGTAWWVAGRTARAWRGSSVGAAQPAPAK